MSGAEDIAHRLHQNERLVLRVLNKGLRDIESIAKEAGLSINAVTWAAYSLKEKGLVKVNEKVRIEYLLGAEGEMYLKKGFPEMRLISKIGDEAAIEGLDLTEDERNYGILWAVKKGLVTIRSELGRKVLKLTDAGRDRLLKGFPEQNVLEKIRLGLELAPTETELLNELEVRGDVIRKKEKKSVEVYLTELGEVIARTEVELAPEVNVLSSDVIVSGKWKDVYLRPYNIEVPTKVVYPGKSHPYQQIIDLVREALIGMGFEEVYSPPVEINFWNCDVLFMPSDHPARDIHDMFYLKSATVGTIADHGLVQRVRETHENGWRTGSTGWGFWDPLLSLRLILRSQTTAVSARYLSKMGCELPRKMFTIDRNYRPEKIDSIHLPEFNQCEGIVAARGVNLRHLMGYMKKIAEVFGAEEVRFQPGFFPFTEPSVVGFIRHPRLGWIEALPGGIFRPEVTKPLGIDVPVLAWGLGIDRLAMIALGVDDIRQLFSADLDWLRNVPFPELKV